MLLCGKLKQIIKHTDPKFILKNIHMGLEWKVQKYVLQM